MKGNASLFIGSAFILIGSNVIYHISQKSIPSQIHSILSSIYTFFIALAISLMILPAFMDAHELIKNIKYINRANFFSGFSIVGIVVGHVLYYRSGWSLSTGTLFSYVIVCILLVPIGLLIFHERITLYDIFGIIFSLVGLYFLTKK